MYASVPTVLEVRVSFSEPFSFARPKSITLILFFAVTITLSALMSRWMMFLECASCSASPIWIVVLRCCVERERPFGKFFPERHPLHIFHHDELTLLTGRFVFLYGIDRADVRMIQHGGRLRFTEKTVIVLLRERVLRGRNFSATMRLRPVSSAL